VELATIVIERAFGEGFSPVTTRRTTTSSGFCHVSQIEWDVDFKLHVPGRAVVEVVRVNGHFSNLEILVDGDGDLVLPH
jgi:hypothetical protein